MYSLCKLIQVFKTTFALFCKATLQIEDANISGF